MTNRLTGMRVADKKKTKQQQETATTTTHTKKTTHIHKTLSSKKPKRLKELVKKESKSFKE